MRTSYQVRVNANGTTDPAIAHALLLLVDSRLRGNDVWEGLPCVRLQPVRDHLQPDSISLSRVDRFPVEVCLFVRAYCCRLLVEEARRMTRRLRVAISPHPCA
jgi:hypothetical protein